MITQELPRQGENQPSGPNRRRRLGKGAIAGITAGSVVLTGGLIFGGIAAAGVDNTPQKPVATGPANPDAEPTAEPTKKPEVVNAFTGVVNYEGLVDNWATADQAQKDALCAEFFGANLPNSATLSETSTGPEIVNWFGQHLDLVNQLNIDTSNPQSHEAALNLSECLTSVHEESQDGRNDIKDNLNLVRQSAESGIDGVVAAHITDVTRYGARPFAADGTVGGLYTAVRVEGHLNDYNKTIVQEIYAFNKSTVFPAYTLAGRLPDGTPMGDAARSVEPIVIDQSRANAAW